MFGLMGVARMSGQGAAWNPRRLFRNSEQGVWYDPSDFSSMYQDAAGTTPVTAVEQPVGLILDKRLGLALGSELVTNGTFTGGGTGWTTPDTAPSTTVFSADSVTMTAAPGSALARLRQDLTLAAGSYELTLSVISYSGTPNCNLALGNTSSGDDTYGNVPLTGIGTFHAIATITGPTLGLAFTAVSAPGGTITIDNVSIKSIAGYHATQATAAARPVVSAPMYINYDGIDDLLATTFPNLGSACTIARAVPMVGASILTGQTISAGVRNDSTNHAGLVIIDRALTAGETTALTAYLDAKAGV